MTDRFDADAAFADGMLLSEVNIREGFVDSDGHYRNKWGAIPGYCGICGNPLGSEEIDWNDGLCDECADRDDWCE